MLDDYNSNQGCVHTFNTSLNTSLSTFNYESKSKPSISEYSLNLKKISRLIQYFFNSSSSKALIFLESNKKTKNSLIL